MFLEESCKILLKLAEYCIILQKLRESLKILENHEESCGHGGDHGGGASL